MEYQAFEAAYLKRVEESKPHAIESMYKWVYQEGCESFRVAEKETGFWENTVYWSLSMNTLVLSPFLFPPFRKEVTD